jgi:hypothetical protein
MSNEFKGTKGEWIVFEIKKGKSRSGTIEIRKEGIIGVGIESKDTVDGNLLVSLCGNKKNEEAVANARLISAAPDLLHALMSIENDDNSIPKKIWDMRNKAIAKALG